MNFYQVNQMDHNSMNSFYDPCFILTQSPALQAATIHDEPNWCTVTYYEMNARVGTPFDDGFTSPHSVDRFCLGVLPNANRDATIEQTRRNIGSGIRIFKDGGFVFVECLSSGSIFVQSKCINEEQGFRTDSVIKVTHGNVAKIFSNPTFADKLHYAAQLGYDPTYKLNEMCVIRLSFVKGWGADYKRQRVNEAPCWLEIRLNGPLQWLDRVLTKIGSSGAQCSSMS